MNEILHCILIGRNGKPYEWYNNGRPNSSLSTPDINFKSKKKKESRRSHFKRGIQGGEGCV